MLTLNAPPRGCASVSDADGHNRARPVTGLCDIRLPLERVGRSELLSYLYIRTTMFSFLTALVWLVTVVESRQYKERNYFGPGVSREALAPASQNPDVTMSSTFGNGLEYTFRKINHTEDMYMAFRLTLHASRCRCH